MGFRFRKQFKIFSGLTFNLNKKSMGFTAGPKGLKTTVNTKGGLRNTIGIPGSGLSYTSYTNVAGSSEQNMQGSNYSNSYCNRNRSVPINQDSYRASISDEMIRNAIAAGDMEKAHAYNVFSYLSVNELMYLKQQAINKGKSKTLARVFAVFGGWLGVERFYVGDYLKGIIYLLTGGLFCFGWIYDIFKIGNRVDSYNADLFLKLCERYLAQNGR